MGDPDGWVRAAGIGLAAGLLAGLFGVGGGIVMVPLLVAWFGLDQRRASATSLLAIIPIAGAAALGYAATGSIDVGGGLLLLLGGVVGG
ncbi:MAG: TSUP family transporter, partial [Candidatus Nanopelagicales bacterium]